MVELTELYKFVEDTIYHYLSSVTRKPQKLRFIVNIFCCPGYDISIDFRNKHSNSHTTKLQHLLPLLPE